MVQLPPPPAHARPPSPARAPSPARGAFPLRAAIILLTVSLFGCDHATKIAAHATLASGRAVPILDGVVELRYAPNFDTAFSLLRTFGITSTSSSHVVLAAASLALAGVVITWFAVRKQATRLQHVGFALVLAGALGNVLDRAVRGYVVDFIHVWRWPTFNVADIAVVAGIVLLGLAIVRQRPAAPLDAIDPSSGSGPGPAPPPPS